MSSGLYNLLATVLLGVVLLSFLASLAFLVRALIGWRTPLRNRRLVRFAVLLVASIVSIVAQQALLYGVYLPVLGQEIRQRAQSAGTLANVGDPAPGFSVVTDDGSSVDLESLRGRVVVLNFFATWCAPCLEELPHLQALWNELRGTEDFAMLVIGREETDDTIASFRAQHGFSFPMAADPERAVYSRYATERVPQTYLISRDGTIVYQCTGFYEEEVVRLRQLAAKQLNRSQTKRRVVTPNSR